MIRHMDGSPFTESEKSSAVTENKKKINGIKSAMTSASNYYSMGQSQLASNRSARSSMSADPFTIYTSSDDIRMASDINAIKSINHNTLTSASYLNNAYTSIATDNNDLVNGTLADQMSADDSLKSASQSSAQLQYRIDNDSAFSASYSASVSASQSMSASFADLPQSKQTSLLNSLAMEKRNRSNSNSGFDNYAGDVTNINPLPQTPTNNGGVTNE